MLPQHGTDPALGTARPPLHLSHDRPPPRGACDFPWKPFPSRGIVMSSSLPAARPFNRAFSISSPFQPPSLLNFRNAVLPSPEIKGRLADAQMLQRLNQRPAACEHRPRFVKLAHHLFRFPVLDSSRVSRARTGPGWTLIAGQTVSGAIQTRVPSLPSRSSADLSESQSGKSIINVRQASDLAKQRPAAPTDAHGQPPVRLE